jgi:hypothetical protein
MEASHTEGSNMGNRGVYEAAVSLPIRLRYVKFGGEFFLRGGELSRPKF